MSAKLRADLEAKLAAVQNWESEDEEANVKTGEVALVSEAGSDVSSKAGLGKTKAGTKARAKGKARVWDLKAAAVVGEMSSSVYIGHIPHGFYEDAMNGFFSQFGEVRRCRVSRSIKTGRSKGFAFVEFTHPSVAKIVAETMDGYYIYDKQLKCSVVPKSQLHERMFDGAGKRFRTIPWHHMHREAFNRDISEEDQASKAIVQKIKQSKKRTRLAALGIDYEYPGAPVEAEEISPAERSEESSAAKRQKRDPETEKVVEGKKSTEKKKRPAAGIEPTPAKKMRGLSEDSDMGVEKIGTTGDKSKIGGGAKKAVPVTPSVKLAAGASTTGKKIPTSTNTSSVAISSKKPPTSTSTPAATGMKPPAARHPAGVKLTPAPKEKRTAGGTTGTPAVKKGSTIAKEPSVAGTKGKETPAKIGTNTTQKKPVGSGTAHVVTPAVKLVPKAKIGAHTSAKVAKPTLSAPATTGKKVGIANTSEKAVSVGEKKKEAGSKPSGSATGSGVVIKKLPAPTPTLKGKVGEAVRKQSAATGIKKKVAKAAPGSA